MKVKDLLNLSLLLLFAALPLKGISQNEGQDIQLPPDSELVVLEALDKLITDWLEQNTKPNLNRNKLNKYNYAPDYVPTVSDSLVRARLAKIETPVPMDFNPTVRSYVDVYTLRRRRQMERMLGLSNYYFPIFEEALDRHGVPHEFRYLPIIESALNPVAVSPMGATGMWQFMYATGQIYGLGSNSYIDDRRDVHLSSDAAARFLKDLHNIFDDWLMVIAAYNCGPGNVNRAIRRAGGSRNFWDIYPFLPRETRGYVPAFIGATYAFTYHIEHNLYPVEITIPLAVDTVMVDFEVNFKHLSEALDLPIELIRDLNPIYKRDIIPSRSQAYPLRLPVQKALAFHDYRDTIYALANPHLFKFVTVNDSDETGEVTQIVQIVEREIPLLDNTPTRVTYTVKSGDNLGVIAGWYDVSVAQLRSWNNIRGNIIRIGQRITIHVPAYLADEYRKVDQMTSAQKARMGSIAQKNPVSPAQQATVTTPSAPAQPNVQTVQNSSAPAPSSNIVYYTIKQGDTLYNIAQRYPGVTAEDIRRMNNISNAKGLRVGQRIKIQTQGS